MTDDRYAMHKWQQKEDLRHARYCQHCECRLEEPLHPSDGKDYCEKCAEGGR